MLCEDSAIIVASNISLCSDTVDRAPFVSEFGWMTLLLTLTLWERALAGEEDGRSPYLYLNYSYSSYVMINCPSFYSNNLLLMADLLTLEITTRIIITSRMIKQTPVAPRTIYFERVAFY